MARGMEMRSMTSSEPHDEAWLPKLIRQMEDIYAAREAANPTPAPAAPEEPYVDKPGTLIAAEKDVFHYEIAERLQRLLCSDVRRCERRRCRRRGRCSTVEELAPAIAVARAQLAAEQARWQPPPPATSSAPRGRRRR
jgi:hypothetical protein